MRPPYETGIRRVARNTEVIRTLPIRILKGSREKIHK